MAKGPSVPPAPELTLDAFLTVTARVLYDDVNPPVPLRDVNRLRMFDTRCYVDQCCTQLRLLPVALQISALER